MDDRLIVALVALAAVASAGAALTSAGAVSASPLGGADADAGSQALVADNESNESNGTAIGTEVSSFMESSSESTNGSVDRGLFDASYNGTNATERDDLVRNRTAELEARLAELREQKRQLKAQKGNISDVAYKARMSSLVTRIHNLEAAINDTERKARETGVDTAQLDRLRSAAGNLSGPEVARIARNLSGVTPGPPPGAGPPGDAGPPSGNETGPPSGNEPGPPGDAGPPGNESGASGNESGGAGGGGDGAGSGNGGGDGGNSGGGDGGGGGGGDGGNGAGDRPRLSEPTSAVDLPR